MTAWTTEPSYQGYECYSARCHCGGLAVSVGTSVTCEFCDDPPLPPVRARDELVPVEERVYSIILPPRA